ncbi:rna polymerase ii elongation factor ell3 [Lasius niger]|uniref:Rna polymerase ii elongation factor ell3 n=1 Tax=Lasius niger TaxID=67767 RepID=A0A0J7KMN3_LASNI|nr:rna polymerase ii elongation factor ell3 [Lasius niger]
MDKTKLGNTTPGGRPVKKLENPPSAEVGPMNSGEGQLLLGKDSFRRSALETRSPVTGATRVNHSIEKENEELRNKLSKIELLTIQLGKEITALKEENIALKKALNI